LVPNVSKKSAAVDLQDPISDCTTDGLASSN
jgi:hypothetical protein